MFHPLIPKMHAGLLVVAVAAMLLAAQAALIWLLVRADLGSVAEWMGNLSLLALCVAGGCLILALAGERLLGLSVVPSRREQSSDQQTGRQEIGD